MAATTPTRRHGNPQPAPLGWRRVLAIFICLWLLALGLQILNRAWNADFGAHPDEAAHVVTGLMVRDYLAGGFLTQLHPLRYAETYYDHFPKVALGHYPPGFYISEALFLLPYPSTGAVLLHLSALAAALSLLTFVVGRRMTGNTPLAFTAAAILVLLPVIQRYTSVVMADLLVALLMLASAVAFARFLVTARSRDSLLFGLLAAATILTKGSGLLLALLPPIAIALTGRWSLIKSRALWLAPLPVLVFALPWMWFTHDISAEGMRGVPLLQHMREALVFYPSYLPRMLGWGWTILIALGVLAALRLIWRASPITTSALPVTLLALVLSLYGFHVLCPIGLEDRYLLPVLAPLMLLGLTVIQGVFRLADLPARAAWVPAAIVCLLAVVEVVRLTPKPDRSFTQLAKLVAGQIRAQSPSTDEPLNVLVSSDARGEGAFIAAMALQTANRSRSPVRVQRSSQQIAKSDWMGRDYQLVAADSQEVEELLDRLATAFVVVDPGLDNRTRRPHHDLVADWWREIHQGLGTAATTADGSPVLVERRPGTAHQP